MTAVSANALTTKFAFAIVNSTHGTRGVRAFEDFFFSGGRVLDDDYAVFVAAHRQPSDVRASARVDCPPSDDGETHAYFASIASLSPFATSSIASARGARSRSRVPGAPGSTRGGLCR